MKMQKISVDMKKTEGSLIRIIRVKNKCDCNNNNSKKKMKNRNN